MNTIYQNKTKNSWELTSNGGTDSMETKIDRFEVKQKSPNEYGLKDHTTDEFIVILNTKDYSDAGNKLVELKNVIDDAITNGDLHL